MKAIVLFFVFTIAAYSQAMRDSSYTVDSTASATTITINVNAKLAAALYRCLGAGWQNSAKDIIVSYTRENDPWRSYKEQYDAIFALVGFTNGQKAQIAAGLGVPDPKLVKVEKRVSVPVLGGVTP